MQLLALAAGDRIEQRAGHDDRAPRAPPAAAPTAAARISRPRLPAGSSTRFARPLSGGLEQEVAPDLRQVVEAGLRVDHGVDEVGLEVDAEEGDARLVAPLRQLVASRAARMSASSRFSPESRRATRSASR